MSEELDYNTIYDSLVEQIKKIETDELSDNINDEIEISEVEKQKVYIWLRVFLKDELTDIKEGDNFKIEYSPSGEFLLTKFIAFGKKNSYKDADDYTQIQMITEDDPKVLCLMVDENEIQNSQEIPFIRTLFKISRHFEYQVYRREELTFTNVRTGDLIDYIDCEF
jgi:hypothetical protein